MSSAPKPDPITTHVLDQTTGRPAAKLYVTLKAPSSTTWEARTSPESGRITQWKQAAPNPFRLQDEFVIYGRADGVWTMTFATGDYFGRDKTFYPEVVVKFLVGGSDERKHWHVPILLGPYGYTTYRGT